MISRPKGTEDRLPAETGKWLQVEKVLRDISERFNYREIRTPIFEHTELFTRTVGETTDIVEKEMYTFKDRAGRSLTLRPEGTAPVGRAYIENGLHSGPQPVKVYYIGPMFRYEKPQAGRYREFVQYGAELLGSSSPLCDAEVIFLAIEICNTLGLTETTLHLNSIGCPGCREGYRKALTEYLGAREADLCDDCRRRLGRNPLRVLDCKNETCRAILAGAPSMFDYLCAGCKEHFETLGKLLTGMGMTYRIDPSLVRGLDYYTRTVFEVKWPPLGAQDAILGGGRYDGLVEALGGPSVPGVGFAIGLERLLMAVEKGKNPPQGWERLDCFVCYVDDALACGALEIANRLRAAGVRADFDQLGRSLKAQMKQASRYEARYAVLLGPEEAARGVATVRSMDEGWQREVRLERMEEEMLSLRQR